MWPQWSSKDFHWLCRIGHLYKFYNTVPYKMVRNTTNTSLKIPRILKHTKKQRKLKINPIKFVDSQSLSESSEWLKSEKAELSMLKHFVVGLFVTKAVGGLILQWFM